MVREMLKGQAFGVAILLCAAVSFAFPSAFVEWGGVKLLSLVVPAIQFIMFGMGTTLSLSDFLRVAKRPFAVALGVCLQFVVMPMVGFLLAKGLGFTGELAAEMRDRVNRLVEEDAACILEEKNYTPEAMDALFCSLIGDDEKRRAMEQNALRRAKPEAKRKIADIILSLVPDEVKA